MLNRKKAEKAKRLILDNYRRCCDERGVQSLNQSQLLNKMQRVPVVKHKYSIVFWSEPKTSKESLKVFQAGCEKVKVINERM